MMFSPASTVIGAGQGRQAEGAGLGAAQTAGILPDVPTMIEAGMPDFDTSIWFGLTGAGRARRAR